MIHKLQTIPNTCFPTLYSLQSITDNQTVVKAPSVSQDLDIGKQHKYIQTSHGQSCCISSSFQSGWADIDCILQKSKRNSQGPLLTFGDLVQFTLCLPIHRGIDTIISRIIPLRVNIIIIIQIRKVTIRHRNIPSQEVRDVDMDMDMVPTMFLVLLVHFWHNTFNKLLQMFL